MAAPILKIGKDPVTLRIEKAKVVTGNFGPQVWCVTTDTDGNEHTLYLPWASPNKVTGELVMSGVAQQFIKTGLIGPEDWDPTEGTWIEAIQGQMFTFDRVFKDGSQYINVKLAGGSQAPRVTPAPLVNAAIRELDLARAEDEAAFAKSIGVSPLAPSAGKDTRPSVIPPSKPKEKADDRIARAFARVMGVYAPQLAEMDGELARAIVALTATHAIAYERE